MDHISVATIAAALAQGLVEVARRLVEQAVVEPALEPATQTLKQWVQHRYRKTKDDETLQKVVQTALQEVENDLGRLVLQARLDRLQSKEGRALRQQLARAVLEFTDPDADPPEDLVTALRWPHRHHRQLARFLTALRAQLYTLDYWRPYIEYADEVARRRLLKNIQNRLTRMDDLKGSNWREIELDMAHELTVDIAILTVLPEEYTAICNRLDNLRSAPSSISDPDLYAWQLGEVQNPKWRRPYSVTVGMMGRAGTSHSALATKDAIIRWKPRYIFFVGIAGGLGDSEKGDVIIADVIRGYEYGKLEKEFVPRSNWTYRVDLALVNNAMAFAALTSNWVNDVKVEPPEEVVPKVLTGEMASGDKVVDDPTNEFFTRIINTWPKLQAVEMEGAGVGNAIEQAQSGGMSVGFLMIRGISDIPRPNLGAEIRGTQERDSWKNYAADTAAAFAVAFIANRLPIPPREPEGQKGIATAVTPESILPSQLPNLTLKLFEMGRDRTYRDEIVFDQSSDSFPQYLFGFVLENTTPSTIARGIYIRVECWVVFLNGWDKHNASSQNAQRSIKETT